jgi:hypothetical protein
MYIYKGKLRHICTQSSSCSTKLRLMLVIPLHSIMLLALLLLLYISPGKSSLSSNPSRRPIRAAKASHKHVPVPDLVSEGDRFYYNRKHKNALFYYSAVMQLLEGTVGEADIRTRRRCELQAADCEMHLGHHLQAIARCSEVINDAPEYFVGSEKDVVYSLAELENAASVGATPAALVFGRAHLIRAKCCIAVGKSQLALRDLDKASVYIADEPEVYELVASIRCSEDGCRPADAPADSGQVDADAKDPTENSDHDFIESCILQHPPMDFTRKQLRALLHRIKKNRSGGVIASASAAKAQHSLSATRVPVGPTFSSKPGDWLSSSMMASLLTNLLGMAPADAENAAEAVGALRGVWKGARRAYKEVNRRHGGIVACLTAFWALVALCSAVTAER